MAINGRPNLAPKGTSIQTAAAAGTPRRRPRVCRLRIRSPRSCGVYCGRRRYVLATYSRRLQRCCCIL